MVGTDTLIIGTTGVSVKLGTAVGVKVGVKVRVDVGVDVRVGVGVELGPTVEVGVTDAVAVGTAGVELIAGWLAVRSADRVPASGVSIGFCAVRPKLERSQA